MADTPETILAVRGLTVNFSTPDGTVKAVKGIDLDIRAGETLAVVGESGSGKSQTMMGIMGLLAGNGTVSGSAKYRGQELVGLPPKALNAVRGAKITMIFQEPMTSLDPLYTIGRQVAEPIVHHRGGSFKEARKRVLELLELVGIPDPARRIDSYPHELSGGQRQRVMIAMALANEPDILIADEPTTALDVTIQAQILDLLRSLQARFGMAIVLITHDLGIVKHFANHVAVMRRGEVVETGHDSGDLRGTQGRIHAHASGCRTERPQTIAAGQCPDHAGRQERHGGLRARRRPVQRQIRHVPRHRRRDATAETGPDHRHRRRIRLRQIHAWAGAAAARSQRRAIPVRAHGYLRL